MQMHILNTGNIVVIRQGAPVSFFKRVKKEYEAFHNMKNSDSDMAKAILREFHNLDSKSIKILTEVAESPVAIKNG